MKQQNLKLSAVALASCAALSACSWLGIETSSAGVYNEQSAWARSLSERNLQEQASLASALSLAKRPGATSVAVSGDGKVRLVALADVPPPPPVATPQPEVKPVNKPAAMLERPAERTVAAVAAPVAAAAPIAVAAQPVELPVATVAQAAQPAPAKDAQPTPAAAAAETQRKAVIEALLAWRKAWMEGDLAAYMTHYGSDFKGDLKSREAWEKQRRARIDKRTITVKVDDLRLDVASDEAKAEFVQHYASKNYKDVGKKRIVMRKTGNAWVIVDEGWQKL